MTQDEVIEDVTRELKGTVVVVASAENGAPEVAWGDTFLSYDPDDITPPEKRFPYATVVVDDYPGFDDASNLRRTRGLQSECVGEPRHLRTRNVG